VGGLQDGVEGGVRGGGVGLAAGDVEATLLG
jgi:hypothetical protein